MKMPQIPVTVAKEPAATAKIEEQLVHEKQKTTDRLSKPVSTVEAGPQAGASCAGKGG